MRVRTAHDSYTTTHDSAYTVFYVGVFVRKILSKNTLRKYPAGDTLEFESLHSQCKVGTATYVGQTVYGSKASMM